MRAGLVGLWLGWCDCACKAGDAGAGRDEGVYEMRLAGLSLVGVESQRLKSSLALPSPLRRPGTRLSAASTTPC